MSLAARDAYTEAEARRPRRMYLRAQKALDGQGGLYRGLEPRGLGRCL